MFDNIKDAAKAFKPLFDNPMTTPPEKSEMKNAFEMKSVLATILSEKKDLQDQLLLANAQIAVMGELLEALRADLIENDTPKSEEMAEVFNKIFTSIPAIARELIEDWEMLDWAIIHPHRFTHLMECQAHGGFEKDELKRGRLAIKSAMSKEKKEGV
jgi:hypothetical protein